MIAIFRSLYPILRASGLRRLAAVLAMMLVQAMLQTVAVFSLIPLLSAAADPAAFRRSRLGARFAEAVGGGSDARVLIWAGAISSRSLRTTFATATPTPSAIGFASSCSASCSRAATSTSSGPTARSCSRT